MTPPIPRRAAALAAALLLALVGPLAAQERPPSAERLERMRMERLRQTLELDRQEAAALERQMGENRRAVREARARMADAERELRLALRNRPPDRRAIEHSLRSLEAERQALQRRHEAHERALAATLTPEQRAKLLLFNQQFDRRLRELMDRRGSATVLRGNAPLAPGARGCPPDCRPREVPPMANPLEESTSERDRALETREEIDAELQRLRRRIETLERRLRALDSVVPR